MKETSERCYEKPGIPFNTTLASFAPCTPVAPGCDVVPSSTVVVVTPLAALANDDMAVADSGGIPSMEGGGGRSDGAPLPFVLGGSGSPPAVVAMAEVSPARYVSGVAVPVSVVTLARESSALRTCQPRSRRGQNGTYDKLWFLARRRAFNIGCRLSDQRPISIS